MLVIKNGTLVIPAHVRAGVAMNNVLRRVVPLLEAAEVGEVECHRVTNDWGRLAYYTVDVTQFPEAIERVVLQAIPWAAKVGGPPSWLAYLCNREFDENSSDEPTGPADN